MFTLICSDMDVSKFACFILPKKLGFVDTTMFIFAPYRHFLRYLITVMHTGSYPYTLFVNEILLIPIVGLKKKSMNQRLFMFLKIN